MEGKITHPKHAYLILTHGNLYVLEKLILLLDDERNDIYIHMDKKVKNFDSSFYENLVRKSNLIFIKRHDIRWGNVISIEVELKLFREAYNRGEDYSYYHLLSGSDLPIKSQDFIHDFFRRNKGMEFVGFSNDVFDKEKISKRHLFTKYMRIDGDNLFQRGLRFIREGLVSLQRSVGYDRLSDQKDTFVFGANWVSITSDLVGDLLKEERRFLTFYRQSVCADEIYKQTFIYNSKYRDQVYDIDDELRSCMRYIDWKRGRPYTFRTEDFEMLMKAEMLFARKFEDSADTKIVDMIYNQLKG